MNRLTRLELQRQLYGRPPIPGGIWKHRTSGIKYRVWPIRIIDEATLRNMVVYVTLSDVPPIVWTREEDEFLSKFEKL